MQCRIPSLVLACALGLPLAGRAQSEASLVLSAVPVASVVGGASLAAGALVVAPVALSTAGAVLTVRAVEASARGSVCVLERASDGARVSVEVAGGSALAVGSAVTVSVLGAGVLLSAAGEVLAFLPNALGQALLYNERVTR